VIDGIDPRLSDAFESIRADVEAGWPTVSIRVTSGYRSPDEQAALRARWDAGQRAGLVVRPAVYSAHSEGRAVDLVFTVAGIAVPVSLTPRQAFSWLATEFQRYGVAWGGRFKQSDVNHFEIGRQA
jgi:LAS superfamily LD-carboxypeptidase LdcB